MIPRPGQESLEGLQRSSITWLVSGQTEKVGGMLHVTSIIVGMSPQLQRNLPKFAGDMLKWRIGSCWYQTAFSEVQRMKQADLSEELILRNFAKLVFLKG